MRLLRITVALSAALTPLVAQTAFSRPMPRASDFPRASNPQVDEPVCYLKTPGGTTFDLVSLCGTNANPPAPNNAAPAASNPTNAPNPNNQAAPNPNAITRDATGAPITTPAGTTTPGNPAVGNPGTSPGNIPNNANPGTSPTGTPNNANPGTAPTGTPNNANPGTSPTGTPNNANPGTSPTSTPNNLTPPSGTAGDGSDGLVPNTNINLPRVPPSSFSPGGVAPTRDAIDGQRSQ